MQLTVQTTSCNDYEFFAHQKIEPKEKIMFFFGSLLKIK
jgi:hypothetical protein